MLKLTIAYDGTGFHGSQRQANGRSVQGDLETAFFRLNGKPMNVVLAGRTDSGVHAIGQVASVEDERPEMSDERVIRALNAHLEDDLAVVACERREAGFHARYDARWREYRYRIWWGAPQPLQRFRAAQLPFALDLPAMGAGATHLIGTIDLASFAGNGVGAGNRSDLGPRGTVRTITHCSVRPVDAWWGTAPTSGTGCELRIVADGFLPQAVRTIAGALIEVGRQRRAPDWIAELVTAGDRREGPKTAPPHGLILWRVGYEGDIPESDESGSEPVASRAAG